MTKLHIAEGLSLPLNAATQTFAFIARKGAGKTYAAGKLCELLLDAGVQVIILDTVGNWYGLRLAADGKGSGFDIPVVGGLRGDIPLQAAGGELIADIVVDTGRSLILDLSQFSLSDRKRFATAFGERLWQRKKGESHPSPVMLVIEESQLIVPQNVGKDEARMVGIYEEIIRLGRNYGIGCTMISQRPQSVNKEVLNQTECLFVGQVNGAQERDALKKWVAYQGMSANLVDELPSLPVGTMYVWSPQWLNILQKVQIAAKRTYDASATPKVGEKRVARELKPLDLDDLKEKMAATIERAKADDPRELKKKIAELERQLRAKPAPETDEATVKRAVDSALAQVQREHRQQFAEIEKIIFQMQNGFGSIIRQAEQFTSITLPKERHADPVITLPPHRREPPKSLVTARLRTPKGDGGGAAALPPGEKAVLRACAQYADGVERDTLSVLTGYKRSSRDAYIQRLQGRSFVTVDGARIVATEEGIAALGSDFEPLPTGEELQRYWLARLPEGEKRVLEILLSAGGKAIPREVIDENTGYKRSSRDAYLQRLSARRLVRSAGRGEVAAAEELF